jgi:ABC-type enterochelin transport system substrate-binding protein
MHARRDGLTPRPAIAALATAILAVALAACSNDSGPSGDPLSKDRYIDKANAICERSKAEAAQIAAPSLADPVAVEQAVAQAVAIQRRALRQLRKLEPPARDEPAVKQWLQAVRGAVDQMDAVRRGLAEGDRDAITEATEKGIAFTSDAEEFADAYGVDECSTSLETQ